MFSLWWAIPYLVLPDEPVCKYLAYTAAVVGAGPHELRIAMLRVLYNRVNLEKPCAPA